MKFIGKVGFWEDDIEVRPGIYRPKIIEKSYTGELLANYRRNEARDDSQNDHVNINNRVSIIADMYMRNHINSIRYVTWQGIRWRVSEITVGFPRIELNIGDEYHVQPEEETPEGIREHTWD